MKPDDLDNLFAALAHPQRRRILDLIRESPGITTADLTPHLGMSGVGVLKHVHILERAGLVLARREGRIRRLYFNVVPIQLVYDNWTDEYSRFWAGRIADLKARLESPSVPQSKSLPHSQRTRKHA